jgi:hypothetical protein
MAVELFLLPMEGAGTAEDPIRAKYVIDPQIIRQGTIRLSRVDHAVVMIEATQAYLDFVRSQADAISLATAQTIDSTINGGQRNTVRNWLENRGIPALWIQIGETRRQVIRGLIGMFLISQRLEGKFGEGFRQRATRYGITLATQWSNLPTAAQDELLDVAREFGIENPGLTATSPLRDVLKVLGDGMQNRRFMLCGIEV